MRSSIGDDPDLTYWTPRPHTRGLERQAVPFFSSRYTLCLKSSQKKQGPRQHPGAVTKSNGTPCQVSLLFWACAPQVALQCHRIGNKKADF